MSEPQTRFDNERLDARLEHVTRAMTDSAQDGDHLRRLATVGTVAGLIAHEFRNLMTPVRSYAQLAMRRDDDPELTRKALEAAFEGAEQAVAIAESLMDLIGMSAAEAAGGGGAPTGASREWCHVERAVQSTLDSLELELAESGVTVEVELEPGLRGAMPEADLRQVLSNLIQNAVRSCGLVEGRGGRGGEVLVSARSVEEGWSLAADLEDGGVTGERDEGCGGCEECGGCSGHEGCAWHIEGSQNAAHRSRGGRVVIEVADRGCGIPAESVGRVFEPFVSGAGGRGMGLATCRALVGKAGGRLGVASERGSGTRFVLDLDHIII